MANVAVKSKQVNIKVSPEQFKALVDRAERRGVSFGVWARAILLQVAAKKFTGESVSVKEPSASTS